MNETFLAAVNELRQQIAGKVELLKAEPQMTEILKLHQALNTLEGVAGEPPTPVSEFFQFGGAASVQTSALAIRPDEFYGLDPLDAAKRYLKKRGQARPVKEIVEAIKRGGGKVDNEKELQVRMARSTYEVAVLPDEHYGLVEFYPHIKRGKGAKKRGVEGDQVDTGSDENTAQKGNAPHGGEASDETL